MHVSLSHLLLRDVRETIEQLAWLKRNVYIDIWMQGTAVVLKISKRK